MKLTPALVIGVSIIAAALTGCGDDASDRKAIACQFEVNKTTFVGELGSSVGDTATVAILSESATISVLEVGKVKRLRVDVHNPTAISASTSPGLPTGFVQRSEADVPERATAGGLVVGGSAPVSEGLLTYACVWR